jgi:hypothetical protein
MGSPSVKQKIMGTVEHLPDDATVEDAMERLYFLAKIERGLDEADVRRWADFLGSVLPLPLSLSPSLSIA